MSPKSVSRMRGEKLERKELLTTGQLIEDLNSIPAETDISSAAFVGDQLLFQGGRSETGLEIWSTDGTVEGTGLLFDIHSGPLSSQPMQFVSSPDRDSVYFVARDSDRRNLWRTDGQSLETVFPGDVTIVEATNVGVYFFEHTELPDGSRLSDLWFADNDLRISYLKTFYRHITPFGQTDDRILFGVGCPSRISSACEVWQSQGTPDTTLQLGAGHSSSTSIVELQGTPYVISEIVSKIEDVELGAPISNPQGRLFSATTQSVLFRDGNRLTAMADIRANPVDLGTYSIPYSNSTGATSNAHYFVDDMIGLWQTDGSIAGTILLHESVHELEIVEATADSVYFTVRDRDDGSRSLWVANADEVTQIETPSGELGDAGIVVHAASDRVFMSTYDVVHGSRLFTIDLTSTPLIATSVVDIWTGTRSSRVIDAGNFQNQLLASVETDDESGKRTGDLMILRPGETEFSKVGPDDFYVTQIEVDGDRVFMIATDDNEVFDVWVADGDLAAPVNVTKPTPDLRPDDGVVVNGHFVFANQRGNRIGRTDGTVTSSEIGLGAGASIQIGQSAAYFWLRRPTELFESGQWYRTDGTLENTTPVSEVDVERDTSVFTIANRRYRLDDSKGWLELDSFGRERPLSAGRANYPRHAVQVQDYVYFVATTETHVNEHPWYVYRLDGVSGTIEQFLEPSVSPSAIAVVDRTLFFGGFDEFHGAELWQVPLPFDGDLDNDGRVDVDDVDALCNAIRDESQSVRFDINFDGIVDFQDFDDMIHDVHQTTYGDASLDGVFDSSDLILVFFEGRFESELSLGDRPSAWRAGDWNCDGKFDASDFILAFRDGGYVRDGIAAQPVRAGIDNQFAASIDGGGRRLDPREGEDNAFVP